ncbi:MAG: Crp/Fnr family transcriptional regulator [Pseudomonadota bacterium]
MISTDETERVRQIAVWSRALTVAECDRVRAGMQIRTYDRGETLGAEGEPVEHWIGVLEGLVKVGTVTPDGKDITFAGMHAGGWFGEGSLLKNECRRYEVVALRPTRAVLLDRATFFWLYENSVPFNQFLITQLNERLGQFIGLIEHARKLDTTTRVARALAGLFNPVLYPGAGQTLAITQEELGLLAGVSRPIANQALRDLERQGLVRVTYGEVTVPDPLALMHLGE